MSKPTIKITTNGNSLTLNDEKKWQIFQIDGLYPSNAQLNFIEGYNFDGSIFTSSKIINRNIVMYIRLNGDVQTRRLELYKYLYPSAHVDLQVSTDSRVAKISGYVETNQIDLWSASVVMQVSIICNEPFFQSISQNTTATISTGLGTVNNFSDVPHGFEAVISASSSFYGLRIGVYNDDTWKYFKITNSSAWSNNTIYYSSISGKLNIGTSSTSSGAGWNNKLAYMTSDSEWLKLVNGTNQFSIAYQTSSGGSWTTSSSVTCYLRYYNQYIGV